MFNLLSNVYHGFLGLFQDIEFNGSSIIKWGIAIFILSSLIRFVVPILGLRLSSGSLISNIGSIRHRYENANNTVPKNKNKV